MPLTPTAQTYATALESIIAAINADPGLRGVTPGQKADGIAAARNLNALLATVIDELGLNIDNVISPEDLMAISDAVRTNPARYAEFLDGHGDDEGNVETGFHLLQNDGGLLSFQGRNMINTVLDAIYHFGFEYFDGRFVNEDGDANEEVADIAGWLNYFLNGQTRVFGTDDDDELGTGNYSTAVSGGANEIFDAGAGDDRIWAGLGHDTINAGTGDDKAGGGAGSDTMNGGSGTDQLWGEAGADKINGDGDDDSLGGGSGNDTISGGDGNDQMWGDEGADTLKGGTGDDVMNGGIGADVLFGNDGIDDIWGDTGDDTIDGGAGDDEAGGGYGNDTLLGGDGNDDLDGNDGSDRLDGGADNDSLCGGGGSDIVHGGDGNDVIDGNDGTDTYRGGLGADLLKLWDSDNARDVIVLGAGESGRTRATIDIVEGFESGEDVIDLRSLGPMTFEDLDFAGGGNASAYFDGRYLRIDTNGDRASDMIIQLKWVEELSSSDFLFA